MSRKKMFQICIWIIVSVCKIMTISQALIYIVCIKGCRVLVYVTFIHSTDYAGHCRKLTMFLSILKGRIRINNDKLTEIIVFVAISYNEFLISSYCQYDFFLSTLYCLRHKFMWRVGNFLSFLIVIFFPHNLK